MSIGNVNTNTAQALQPNPTVTRAQPQAVTTASHEATGPAPRTAPKPVLNTQGQLTGQLLNVTA